MTNVDCNKIDAKVQTVLYCREDSFQKVKVLSNHNTQTIISTFPLEENCSIFIGLLEYIPFTYIVEDSETVVRLPRKIRLTWADMSGSNIPKGIKVDAEIQTKITVYPHILKNDDVALVIENVACQTSITALPDDSTTNILPYLKTQLTHSEPTEESTVISYAQQAQLPPESVPISQDGELEDDGTKPAHLPVTDAPISQTEELKEDEEMSQLTDIDDTVNEEAIGVKNELDPIQEVSERINYCKKIVDEPCQKDPCIAKVICREDCFENKMKGVLQLAVEVFEKELIEFFEDNSSKDDKKAAICRELINFAETPCLSSATEKKTELEEWDLAVKQLEKIASEGKAEALSKPNLEINSKDFIRTEELYNIFSPGTCTCQVIPSQNNKRPSKIPKLLQCRGKIEKFCGVQQSSKIPVTLRTPSKDTKKKQTFTASTVSLHSNEICFSLNTTHPQKVSDENQIPQEFSCQKFLYRPPTAMKRNIQIGVGYRLGDKSDGDDIAIEELPCPTPVQEFVYECDVEYAESYLETLGTEIKGCQTEHTDAEGDWEWEEEEEDVCFCDPWGKIAVPLPGTYVLKKKKKSVHENEGQNDSVESPSTDPPSKSFSVGPVRLPVYDPKYFRTTELYMEALYDIYPVDDDSDDICGPETEMPWEDILLPERCRIKRAYPTVCTCPTRRSHPSQLVSQFDKHSNCLLDKSSTIKITAKATVTEGNPRVVIDFKSTENNSYKCDSDPAGTCNQLSSQFKPKEDCSCPKPQPPYDFKCNLETLSTFTGKVSKKIDLPSNPPKGCSVILKNVGKKQFGAGASSKPSPDKCDQSTSSSNLPKQKGKSGCHKTTNTNCMSANEKPMKKKCNCKKSSSTSNMGKCDKETNANITSTAVKKKSFGNGSNGVECGSSVAFSSSCFTSNSSAGCDTSVGCGSCFAAEKDKTIPAYKSSKKSTATSCNSHIKNELPSGNSVTKIRATLSLKRVGQPDECVSKEIPLNNEIYEIYNKGSTRVQLGVKKVLDKYGTIQPAKALTCALEDNACCSREEKSERKEKKQDAACGSSSKKKYPVVAALNAFEEEMRPLRAALHQLQKRIYSLDLTDIRQNPTETNEAAVASVRTEGKKSLSSTENSRTEISASTDPCIYSSISGPDYTFKISSTTICSTNNSEKSED